MPAIFVNNMAQHGILHLSISDTNFIIWLILLVATVSTINPSGLDITKMAKILTLFLERVRLGNSLRIWKSKNCMWPGDSKLECVPPIPGLTDYLRYDKANNKNKDLDCVRMENGKFTRVPCTSTSGAYVCENHNYGDRCQASQTKPKIDNRYFISNDARKGWEG